MISSRTSGLRRVRSLNFHRPISAHHPRASIMLGFASVPSSSVSTCPLIQPRYQDRGYGIRLSFSTLLMAASAIIAGSGALSGDSIQCEAREKQDQLPTYTMAQVSKNNGEGPEKRVWMTYGGCVYDVTDFIANHPGGSQKILLAAGGPIEPHWHAYRQHFSTDLPQRYMEKMLIGNLDPSDQETVDEIMDKLSEDIDPYENEPTRSPLLRVHGDTPMNAEVPADILNENYITPVSEFYIRHHHPVPLLSQKQAEDFRLDVDLSLLAGKKQTTKISLAQIKSLPKVEVTSTLQCSGNRRSEFNDLRETSGTPWSQGAISTAKWGGARLVDVLVLASEQLTDDVASQGPVEGDYRTSTDKSIGCLPQTLQNVQKLLDMHPNLQHIRFDSLDGMSSSVDVGKALSPFGDVIIAYEMNDEPLNREHGYPLRVITPGYAAVRSPKWVSRVELAKEQAEGAWHRGLNYKILPPSVQNANEVDLEQMPGLSEVSVFSGITKVSRLVKTGNDPVKKMVPGETVLVKASGWAWAGGGRNIVRVDLTGDNGKTWAITNITHGSGQPHGKAWAWVFWECPSIPATVCEDGVSVQLSCKGVDKAFNTQPESSDGMWNVRGLGNNSWFRLKHRVA